MPNGMRRERVRGGGAVSHVHYDSHMMSQDERLKMTILGRRRLKRCIWTQSVFHILKASLIIYAYINHERVTQATIAACACAFIAIFSGINGLERQSIGWMKVYILFMAMSATLAAYPLYKQGSKGSGWSIYQGMPESQRFPKLLNAKHLEKIQDIGSITAQVLGLAAAINLLKHFSAPRHEKTVMHLRERRSTRERDR